MYSESNYPKKADSCVTNLQKKVEKELDKKAEKNIIISTRPPPKNLGK